MHPSVLASHLGGLFHHKPALVASVILWLEYLLCAHHLPSTSGNIPHCPLTHALMHLLPARLHSPILPSLPSPPSHCLAHSSPQTNPRATPYLMFAALSE